MRRDVAALIGDPVAHSLSPVLHAAAYRALGLEWTYLACTVASRDVRAALEGARALGFRGLSVTMPHKEAVALAADERSATVERLGAANTVTFAAGVAIAESTDGEGLLDDLAEWGFDLAGARCGVVGAGGAARAVVLALAEAGAASVLVVNRDPGRAARAVALAGESGRAGSLEELGDCSLVIQATPLGMEVTGDAGAAASAAIGSSLHAGQFLVDLVYAPAFTPCMRAAAQRGVTVRGGIGMLVHQAARQVARWTGERAPVEAMRAAVTS